MISYTIGLDLGGTKLASSLVRSDGKMISSQKDSVVALKALENVKKSQALMIELMIQHCLFYFKNFPEFTNSKKFKGIGLASAGPLNVEKGELIDPSNFPLWKKFTIVKKLEEALKKSKRPSKVYFQNDAVAAALAEGWTGAAKGLSSYAVITVGTGIGTGVIFNHRPVQSRGMGSEFGHLIVDQSGSTSFYRKTVEGIASGTALVQRANTEFNFPCQQVEEIVDALSVRPDLLKLFEDAAVALASLCFNLSIGFNLEKILFSGGLSQVSHLYMDRLHEKYKENINSFNTSFKAPLQMAKTGNRAGTLGAARLPYLI